MSQRTEEDLAYAEFTFRIHADGRRERRAVVYVRDGDTVRPARTPLTGAAERAAIDGIEETILAPRRRRSVAIDARADRRAERRRR